MQPYTSEKQEICFSWDQEEPEEFMGRRRKNDFMVLVSELFVKLNKKKRIF